MSKITCVECGIRFGVPYRRVQELRDTGAVFWCPNGDQLEFEGGPSLREELAEARRRLSDWREGYDKLSTENLELMKRVKELEAWRDRVRSFFYYTGSMYWCRECKQRHRFDSDLGEEHFEYADVTAGVRFVEVVSVD